MVVVGWHDFMNLCLHMYSWDDIIHPFSQKAHMNEFLWGASDLWCSHADFQVRDELEHLLDDDEDMAEMYLTEKMIQQLENSSGSSLSENDEMDDEVLQSDKDDRHVMISVSL